MGAYWRIGYVQRSLSGSHSVVDHVYSVSVTSDILEEHTTFRVTYYTVSAAKQVSGGREITELKRSVLEFGNYSALPMSR